MDHYIFSSLLHMPKNFYNRKIKISKQTKPIKNKHVDTEKRIVIIREKEVGEWRVKWVKEINYMVMETKFSVVSTVQCIQKWKCIHETCLI